MGKYQAYTEYNHSGNEFVGVLPAKWERCTVDSVSYVIDPQPDHRAPEICSDGEGFPYVGIRDVNPDGTLNFDTARPVKESAVIKQEKSFSIEPNDIIFCKVGTLGLPRKIVPHGRCALSATLVLIKTKPNFISQFLLYALDSCVVTSQTDYLATGSTRAALGIQQIRRFQIPKPTVAEQTQIANFLDHETAKIDTLIEKQQQLIKLLKEKRQAVISHAVTKGLNPDVPMKDSGVEWLGEVPAHWKLVLFKYLVSQMGGGTPDKGNVSFWNGNIPWVSPKDMKVDYISTSQDFITDVAVKNSSTKLVPDQSILMVVRGMILIHSIPVALTTRPVTINQDMKALIPNKEIQPEFLLFFLKGIKDYILDFVETSAHGTKCLRTEDFENMCLFIPPIDEQVAILSSIKTSLDKLDLLIQKAETAIELLKERRTALISAAVTGKIDVRNWQNIHVKKEEEAS